MKLNFENMELNCYKNELIARVASLVLHISSDKTILKYLNYSIYTTQ